LLRIPKIFAPLAEDRSRNGTFEHLNTLEQGCPI
jgi:hypothetical protein